MAINGEKTIFILCAGSGERWNNYMGIPKQLIEFNSETLLDRTIRLSRTIVSNAVIYVVANERLTKSNEVYFLKPKNTSFTVETILSTRNYWGDEVIVLLGDVFYSSKSIKRITENNKNYSFYGKVGNSKFGTSSHGEIYAFKVLKAAHTSINEYAHGVCKMTRRGNFGNLWDLYHSITGLPFRSGAVERKYFVKINDFTEDFDRPSEFEAFKNMYEILAGGRTFRKIPMHAKILVYQIRKFFSDKRFNGYRNGDWKFVITDCNI